MAKFTEFNEVANANSGDCVLIGNTANGVRRISLTNLIKESAYNWTKAPISNVDNGVSIGVPADAKEYLIIAIGSGSVFSKVIPNITEFKGVYIIVEYLDGDYIRIYNDGNGNMVGEKSGYKYTVYYK